MDFNNDSETNRKPKESIYPFTSRYNLYFRHLRLTKSFRVHFHVCMPFCISVRVRLSTLQELIEFITLF